MKKKIVFVTKQMVIGGIEKSLNDLLERISPEEFEVTLLVQQLGGEFEKNIPTYVKVKEIPGINVSGLKLIFNDRDIFAIAKRLFIYLKGKVKNDYWEECVNSCVLLPQYNEYPDLAISYSSPVSLSVAYVANNIRAKKKCVWIHNEIDMIDVDIKKCKNIYSSFDKIFCVSKLAKKKLLNFFPEYEKKTDVFYNFFDKEDILKKSFYSKSFDDGFKGIRILTVGRLCSQKGQDIIPSVINVIRKHFTAFKWYCVGDGDMRDYIESLIKKYNLEDTIILLGKQTNPYGYFRDCDIYVQTSRHEGFGLTISEAKSFDKPIVSTYFAGIDEQIVNGYNGFVTEFEINSIAEKILYLLENPESRESFALNLRKESISFGNIEMLYELLNEKNTVCD